MPPTDADLDDDTPLPPDPTRVVARLHPSTPRRVLAAVILGSLGALLIWIAMAHPPQGLIWRVFLLGFGAFMLWATVRMWQSTALALELTGEELRDSNGTRLALLSDVQSVSRGVFAFKPSNGFLLKLATPGLSVWAPGLWWRLGRSIGVGGVTDRNEARFMAEMMEDLLNRRD